MGHNQVVSSERQLALFLNQGHPPMGGGRGVEAVYASTRKEQKSSAPGHCSGPGFSFLPLLFCLPCCAARVSHQPEFSIPCGAGRPQKLGSRLHMRRHNGRWELALTANRHQGSQKDCVGSLELNGVLKPLVGTLPFDDIRPRGQLRLDRFRVPLSENAMQFTVATVKEFNQLFAIFLAPASHTATALLK